MPMPICHVCQGDGVAQVLGLWYCIEHIEDAFLELAKFLARARGWDQAQTEGALLDWLDQ